MKKILPLAIILLLIGFAAGAFYFFRTSKPMAVAKLTITPQPSSVRVGEEVLFRVMLDAGQMRLVGVESQLRFDPKALAILSVTAGPLFTQPLILREDINQAGGLLNYALGDLQTVSGQGEVYTVRARVLAQTQNKILRFERAGTKIALTDPATNKRFSESESSVEFIEDTFTILP